jgi:hypothetical protein
MLGSRTHNILAGIEQIDGMLQRANSFLTKKYNLILTSHEVPESIAIIDEKIRYLKKTRDLVKSSKTKEEFISAMNAAFPDYAGENYLEMSAGALVEE